jgi:hypothetical protein
VKNTSDCWAVLWTITWMLDLAIIVQRLKLELESCWTQRHRQTSSRTNLYSCYLLLKSVICEWRRSDWEPCWNSTKKVELINCSPYFSIFLCRDDFDCSVNFWRAHSLRCMCEANHSILAVKCCSRWSGWRRSWRASWLQLSVLQWAMSSSEFSGSSSPLCWEG